MNWLTALKLFLLLPITLACQDGEVRFFLATYSNCVNGKFEYTGCTQMMNNGTDARFAVGTSLEEPGSKKFECIVPSDGQGIPLADEVACVDNDGHLIQPGENKVQTDGTTITCTRVSKYTLRREIFTAGKTQTNSIVNNVVYTSDSTGSRVAKGCTPNNDGKTIAVGEKEVLRGVRFACKMVDGQMVFQPEGCVSHDGKDMAVGAKNSLPDGSTESCVQDKEKIVYFANTAKGCRLPTGKYVRLDAIYQEGRNLEEDGKTLTYYVNYRCTRSSNIIALTPVGCDIGQEGSIGYGEMTTIGKKTYSCQLAAADTLYVESIDADAASCSIRGKVYRHGDELTDNFNTTIYRCDKGQLVKTGCWAKGKRFVIGDTFYCADNGFYCPAAGTGPTYIGDGCTVGKELIHYKKTYNFPDGRYGCTYKITVIGVRPFWNPEACSFNQGFFNVGTYQQKGNTWYYCGYSRRNQTLYVRELTEEETKCVKSSTPGYINHNCVKEEIDKPPTVTDTVTPGEETPKGPPSIPGIDENTSTDQTPTEGPLKATDKPDNGKSESAATKVPGGGSEKGNTDEPGTDEGDRNNTATSRPGESVTDEEDRNNTVTIRPGESVTDEEDGNNTVTSGPDGNTDVPVGPSERTDKPVVPGVTDVPVGPEHTDVPVGPRVTDVPVVPEVTDVPVGPEHTDVPVGPEHTDVPVGPEHTDVPVGPRVTDVPVGPEHTDVPVGPEHTDVPVGPRVTDVPVVPGVTDVPVVPGVTDVPVGPEHTDVPVGPRVTDIPVGPEHTDVPVEPNERTDKPVVPGVTDVPVGPEHTDVPVGPRVTDVPVVPEVTDVPVGPEHTDVPVGPEHTDVPVGPEHTDVPVGPRVTDVPVVPGVTDVPVGPEHTDVPVGPRVTDIPVGPEHTDVPVGPRVTDVPVVPGVTDVPVGPEHTDVPVGPRVTDVPVVPGVTDVPVGPEHTDVPVGPRVTDVPVVPGVTDVPVGPEHTDVPVEPRVTDVPVVPGVTDVPVGPEHTDVPVGPRVTDIPVGPEHTDVPVGPRVTDVPVVPGVTDVPVGPEHTDVPVEPNERTDKPVVPGVTDVPVGPEHTDVPVGPRVTDVPVVPGVTDVPVGPEHTDVPVGPRVTDIPVGPEHTDVPVEPNERTDKPVVPGVTDVPVGPEHTDVPVGPEHTDVPVGPSERTDKPVGPEGHSDVPIGEKTETPYPRVYTVGTVSDATVPSVDNEDNGPYCCRVPRDKLCHDVCKMLAPHCSGSMLESILSELPAELESIRAKLNDVASSGANLPGLLVDIASAVNVSSISKRKLSLRINEYVEIVTRDRISGANICKAYLQGCFKGDKELCSKLAAPECAAAGDVCPNTAGCESCPVSKGFNPDMETLVKYLCPGTCAVSDAELNIKIEELILATTGRLGALGLPCDSTKTLSHLRSRRYA